MADDGELVRLRAEQSQARQREQQAARVLRAAGERLSKARNVREKRDADRRRAYDDHDTTLQRLEQLQIALTREIERTRAKQAEAYGKMHIAYQQAKLAHRTGNVQAARSKSIEGQRARTQAQKQVTRRQEFVARIEAAQAEHDATKPRFVRTMEDYDAAKRVYDQLATAYERAKSKHAQAEQAVAASDAAVKARLKVVQPVTHE